VGACSRSKVAVYHALGVQGHADPSRMFQKGKENRLRYRSEKKTRYRGKNSQEVKRGHTNQLETRVDEGCDHKLEWRSIDREDRVLLRNAASYRSRAGKGDLNLRREKTRNTKE